MCLGWGGIMARVCLREGGTRWPVPNSISDEFAAQFVINPFTAYGLFENVKVPKGEYLLITAAGSALGRMINSLAKHRGLKTINIVRRSEQKEELKALGADVVISSSDEDVVARVKEVTNDKLAYAAMDSVGGSFTQTIFQCVRCGGEVCVYGALGGADNATAGIRDFFRGVKMTGYVVSSSINNDERLHEYFTEVCKLLENKILQPLVGEKYDFADINVALKKSEHVARAGKVLLTS